MSGTRPVPVPDAASVPFWAAASRHRLTAARCARCATFAIPPAAVCAACGSTDPEYTFTALSGHGVVRSWTVVRQAFLPGFDVPFVLVDVELCEQADLRLVVRLVDGAEAPMRIGARVRVGFEQLSPDIALPVFELVR